MALELPAVAVPAYRTAAEREDSGDCEMAAALAAAPDRCVGVDGPSAAFLTRLVREVLAERPDRDTLRRLASSTWIVSARTARRRITSAVPWLASDDGGPTRTHDCTAADPPSVQAESERRAVRHGRALHGVAETPPAVRVRTRVREAHMAARIEGYRSDGDVVAVVGVAHLDGLAERLATD